MYSSNSRIDIFSKCLFSESRTSQKFNFFSSYDPDRAQPLSGEGFLQSRTFLKQKTVGCHYLNFEVMFPNISGDVRTRSPLTIVSPNHTICVAFVHYPKLLYVYSRQ